MIIFLPTGVTYREVGVDAAAKSFKLIDLLLKAVQSINKGKKERATALKSLADRKLSELEETHRLFIGLLQEMYIAVKSTSVRLRNTDDVESAFEKLRSEIDNINLRRLEERYRRIETRAEAKILATHEIKDHGMFRTVDYEITGLLKELMLAYSAYFHDDTVERHSLGVALQSASYALWQLKHNEAQELTKKNLQTACAIISEISEQKIARLEGAWGEVATRYHKLSLALFERGYITTTSSKRRPPSTPRTPRARRGRSSARR